MTIAEIQEEIIDEFAFFEDWMQRYEHMIALGNHCLWSILSIKPMNSSSKAVSLKFGLHAELQEGKVMLTADSDAIITKGIVALLIRVFSGQSPEAIVNADLAFVDEIGLKEHLSPTRANGLVSMIKQIKLYAVAYQSQLKA